MGCTSKASFILFSSRSSNHVENWLALCHVQRIFLSALFIFFGYFFYVFARFLKFYLHLILVRTVAKHTQANANGKSMECFAWLRCLDRRCIRFDPPVLSHFTRTTTNKFAIVIYFPLTTTIANSKFNCKQTKMMNVVVDDRIVRWRVE